MVSSHEIISIIKGFSTSERLFIVEEILRNIREEHLHPKTQESDKQSKSPILNFVGIIDDTDAELMENAVEESRKIDKNEW